MEPYSVIGLTREHNDDSRVPLLRKNLEILWTSSKALKAGEIFFREIQVRGEANTEILHRVKKTYNSIIKRIITHNFVCIATKSYNFTFSYVER